MNPRVKSVTALPLHRLSVVFTDGQQRRMDVSPYLAYPAFHPLRDPDLFRRVSADHGTVAWPGGIDLDPDTVFLESAPEPTDPRESPDTLAHG
jgi:hypothetical protein